MRERIVITSLVSFLLGASSCTVKSKSCTTDSNGNDQCTETTVDIEATAETGTSSAASSTTTDINLSNNSILEFLPVGSTVGNLQAVPDPSPDIVSFSLISGDGDSGNAFFDISGNSLQTKLVLSQATATSHTVRIAATSSTSGEALEKKFTITVAQQFPSAKLINDSAQLLSNGPSFSRVEWSSAEFDSAQMYNVVNHGINTVKQGYYLSIGNVSFDVNNTNERSLRIVDNNTNVLAIQTAVAADETATHVAAFSPFISSEWLGLEVAQDSGSALNIPQADFHHFTAQYFPDAIGARVEISSDVTLGNNSLQTIAWNTEEYDTSNFHDNVTENSKLTIPAGEDGWYLTGISVSFSPNPSLNRLVGIGVNDSNEILRSRVRGTNWEQAVHAIGLVKLAAGDYLEAFVHQDSGAGLDYLSGNSTDFFIHKINSTSSANVAVSFKSDQAIPDSTWTTLTWDGEVEDNISAHDDVTNNSRFTASSAGRYLIVFTSQWVNNFTGNRGTRLVKNTSQVIASETRMATSLSEYTLSTIVELDAGDFIEAEVYHSAGGVQNLTSLLGTYGQFENSFYFYRLN